jgi:hypothetical protein
VDFPASEHRERLERFVCRENVARFPRLLTTESDEAERALLFELLIEEQESRSISRFDQEQVASFSMQAWCHAYQARMAFGGRNHPSLKHDTQNVSKAAISKRKICLSPMAIARHVPIPSRLQI